MGSKAEMMNLDLQYFCRLITARDGLKMAAAFQGGQKQIKGSSFVFCGDN